MNLIERMKRLAVWEALLATNGNKTKAGERLDVTRPTLKRWLKEWEDDEVVMDELIGTHGMAIP